MTFWMFNSDSCQCDIEEKVKSSISKRSKKIGDGELILGERLNIIEELGTGGMGTVFKTQDLSDSSIVAVKVLHKHLAKDPFVRKRFMQECLTLEKLTHTNIVRFLGYGEASNGLPFLVMEFIEGHTLAKEIESSGKLDAAQAIPIFFKTLQALDYAHSKGIIHRDLKPNNIILTRDESSLKIVDFGISKVLEDESDTTSLTQTGEVFGSPLYMSPEQCQGEAITIQSDIYSMGCIMYETLSGIQPFRAETALATILKHINGDFKPLSKQLDKSEIPEFIEYAVTRCLNQNPDTRPQSAKAVIKILEGSDTTRVKVPLALPFLDKSESKSIETSKAIIAVLIFSILYAISAPAEPISNRFSDTKSFLYTSRNGGRFYRANFQNLKLNSKNLAKLSFKSSSFSNTTFSESFIEHCKFNGCKFENCEFVGSRFERCELHNCEFTQCNGQACTFFICDLNRTKFRSSNFKYSVFKNCFINQIERGTSEFDATNFKENLKANRARNYFPVSKLYGLSNLIPDKVLNKLEDGRLVTKKLPDTKELEKPIRSNKLFQKYPTAEWLFYIAFFFMLLRKRTKTSSFPKNDLKAL